MKKLSLAFCALLASASFAQCPPDLNTSMLTKTLTCKNPTILATGSSTTPNTVITWSVPTNPPGILSPTLIIGIPANGPNTSTTTTQYATYTVYATNTLSACQSSQVIVINQNFKPPVSAPQISIASATAIYCNANVNPVVLSVGNSTTTSGGGPTAFIANPCWAGPAPQTPTCGQSSYSCYVPGIYSLTVEDNYNGCKSTGTINVINKTQPPVLISPVSTYTVGCEGLHTFVIPSAGNPYRIYFTHYPPGASFSPTTATVAPGVLGDISVNGGAGTYVYNVSHTQTACSATGTVNVIVNDQIGGIQTFPQAPTCSVCCDGSMSIVPPAGFSNYSVTVSQGTLSGSPATSVGNLCYGKLKYCFYNTSNNCKRCDSINVDAVTAINEITTAENKWIIYPNPSISGFYMKNTAQATGLVKIYNPEGKLLEELSIASEQDLKIEGLSAGIYFVEINVDGMLSRKKVVVLSR